MQYIELVELLTDWRRDDASLKIGTKTDTTTEANIIDASSAAAFSTNGENYEEDEEEDLDIDLDNLDCTEVKKYSNNSSSCSNFMGVGVSTLRCLEENIELSR